MSQVATSSHFESKIANFLFIHTQCPYRDEPIYSYTTIGHINQWRPFRVLGNWSKQAEKKLYSHCVVGIAVCHPEKPPRSSQETACSASGPGRVETDGKLFSPGTPSKPAARPLRNWPFSTDSKTPPGERKEWRAERARRIGERRNCPNVRIIEKRAWNSNSNHQNMSTQIKL